MSEEKKWEEILSQYAKEQTKRFSIPSKKCPICGEALINHRIPFGAVQRFINSKHSQLYGENLVLKYFSTLLPSSVEMSSRGLLRACWILHMTPKELVELGTNNKQELKKKLDSLDLYLANYFKNPSIPHVISKHAVKNICRSLAGFLRVNGVVQRGELFPRVFSMNIPKQKNYLPTKTDIKKLYFHAKTLRDKALIQFLANCPLRKREITRVKWSDINLEEEYPILVIEDKRLKGAGKGKYSGCTFAMVISQNLKKLLKKLKEVEKARFKKCRRMEIERLLQEGYPLNEAEEKTKHLTWSDDLPIFLSSDFVMDKRKGVRVIKKLEQRSIGYLFNELQKISGLPISCHLFRNYVETIITKKLGQANPLVDLALAHKPTGVRSKYQQVWKDREQMIKWFEKIEPYLDLELEPKKKVEIALKKFKELKAKGVSEEEAFTKAFETVQQMFLKEMTEVKNALLKEIEEAREEYERRYLK
ncbi:MAG: hypothetical protein DRP00_04445 [Candidatus Aenigmatarchaeota archaeon]|nr:MAG: hypothetical protein DRP00_04445 [Candidatus Aenigmarchaeota archaeon]